MKALLTTAFLLTFVLGCQMPRTNVQTVDGRPKVLIRDAPKGALLFVDGNAVGQADTYSGDPTVPLLEPGTHLIEIKAGNALLFSQRLFLGGAELRTITVPRGVAP